MDSGSGDLSWQDDAVCAEVGPEFFFPEGGMDNLAAKKMCANCPVAKQCLELGMSFEYGISGGKSAKQRHELKRRAA